ncbi:MAG: hypothetical protein RIM23_28425 [Coleofasciculus sp. G3-WIS-01]|uniref:hypothetical protein n=1 Tax=Coleofasciculus sp. G3-WIS-01 TaxID=3069528 RepID=UPI0032F0F9DB
MIVTDATYLQENRLIENKLHERIGHKSFIIRPGLGNRERGKVEFWVNSPTSHTSPASLLRSLETTIEVEGFAWFPSWQVSIEQRILLSMGKILPINFCHDPTLAIAAIRLLQPFSPLKPDCCH